MKFYKDSYLERWHSGNGMWMMELGNGEYVISIKTNSGAWREVCAYKFTGKHKEALDSCKQYINYVCTARDFDEVCSKTKPLFENEVSIKEMFYTVDLYNDNNDEKYLVLFENMSSDGLEFNDWMVFKTYDEFIDFCNGDSENSDSPYVEPIIDVLKNIKVIPDKKYEFHYSYGLGDKTIENDMKFIFRIVHDYHGYSSEVDEILNKDGFVFE